MGRSNDTTLGLSLTDPSSLLFPRLRRTAEISIPTSLINILQCYAGNTILWVLELWKARPGMEAFNGTHGIVFAVATLLSILATTFRYTTQATPNGQPGLNGCLPSMFGAFVAALGIRLARSVGGYEASSQANLNAIAIIMTTSIMRLAGIQAKLMEPSMQSLRGMFLTLDFLVPVMIVCFTTYKQVADFGCPANILMLQAAEFALALVLDWAHIKTAVGPGQVARRGGGEERNLPNLGAQPDSEWELLH